MKYLIFAVTALFTSALPSFAQKSPCRLVIEAGDYPKDTIRVLWDEGGQMIEKKIPLHNGKGHINIPAPEYSTVLLMNDDKANSITMPDGAIPGPQFHFFSEPGKQLTVRFKTAEWPAVTISGGKTNQEYLQFWKDAGPLERKLFALRRDLILKTDTDKLEVQRKQKEVGTIDNDIMALQRAFIDSHPGSFVSLYLLQGESVMMPVADYEKKFMKLDRKVRETEAGKRTAAWIATAKRTLPGQPAADFTKKDKDGKVIRLSDYRGKYVLIDFWGTWCIPCRKSHPHLVSLFEKYGKDDLVFINIAQEGGDNPRPLWLQAIEEDHMTWTQILNNEDQDKSDVVQLYSVQAFPTKILIDREGKIIKRFQGDVKEIDVILKDIFGK